MLQIIFIATLSFHKFFPSLCVFPRRRLLSRDAENLAKKVREKERKSCYMQISGLSCLCALQENEKLYLCSIS